MSNVVGKGIFTELMESSPKVEFNLSKSTRICAPQLPILSQESHCLAQIHQSTSGSNLEA